MFELTPKPCCGNFRHCDFPDDPIRDYVEKKVVEIEERYRWIDEFY